MAKAKELTVSLKQVKNLGNYQSLTAEASLTMVLAEGDDTDLEFANAWGGRTEGG